MESLLIAIVSNTVMIFALRYAEKADTNRKGVILWNYVFGTVLAVVINKGFIGQAFSTAEMNIPLGLGLFNAFLMVGCMLIQQRSICTNGAGMTTTYNRLGILIPTLLSIVLFQEYPQPLKIMGIVLSISAVLYSYEKDSINGTKNYTLLILVLVIGGFIDFNSKLLGILALPEMKHLYTCSTFFFSVIIMAILTAIGREKITIREIGYGALVGIPNIGITYGIVGAAAKLPAYIVFPVYSGAVILLVNGIGGLLLKEKLSRREFLATGMIAAALALLNI